MGRNHPIIQWKSIPPVLLCWLFAACGSSKTAAKKSGPTSGSQARQLNHIQVVPGQSTAGSTAAPQRRRNNTTLPANTKGLEWLDPLLFKYAILLNTEVEQLNDLALWQFIDRWYGTRYQYGGNSLSGVDCSGFTQQLCATVYGLDVPRTSKEQYQFCQRIDAEELREGDLVFFNTSGGVSHVGIYLRNNKFVHASTSSGVMISDLQEPYYRARWVGAGRLGMTP